jgi:hypothetical protein
MYGTVSSPYPSVRAIEMTTSLAENFKMGLMTFVAMIQIYASLKTDSPLKSATLQMNYNLN